MNLLFKIISITYLIILTFVFLIPLYFFEVSQIITKEQQLSNNTSFLIHLFLFFILYLFFWFSFSNKKTILLFCIFYGILIEIMQIFTLRGFQILDILFNIFGIIIACLFIDYFYQKKIIKNNKII